MGACRPLTVALTVFPVPAKQRRFAERAMEDESFRWPTNPSVSSQVGSSSGCTAKTVAQRPKLVLADEFLGELDDNVEIVMETVRHAIEAQNSAMIMVEHHEELADGRQPNLAYQERPFDRGVGPMNRRLSLAVVVILGMALLTFLNPGDWGRLSGGMSNLGVFFREPWPPNWSVLELNPTPFARLASNSPAPWRGWAWSRRSKSPSLPP